MMGDLDVLFHAHFPNFNVAKIEVVRIAIVVVHKVEKVYVILIQEYLTLD